MPGPKLERQNLVLLALALPIIGMIALFAWAGAVSSASTTGVVQSFIDAYNAHDCAAVRSILYRAPGSPGSDCAALVGAKADIVFHCNLSTLPTSEVTNLASQLPSGYTRPALVRASCMRYSKSSGASIGQPVLLNFLTAVSQNGQSYVIGIRSAG